MITAIRKFLVSTSIIIFTTVLAFVVTEYGYRAYIYYSKLNERFAIVIVDQWYDKDSHNNGLYKPNLNVLYQLFTFEDVLGQESQFHTNNLGYISHQNYRVEKEENEFRIAVLGDSLTASVNSDFPWTDVASRLLDGDAELKATLGLKRITVMNFGKPGAGFPDMARIFVQFARQFKPDLVLVNFITADFPRTGTSVPDASLLTQVPESVELTVGFSGGVDYKVEGFTAGIYMTCASPGVAIEKMDCAPTRLLKVPSEIPRTANNLTKIRQAVTRAVLKPRLLRSTYPYSLASIMGRNFDLGYATTGRMLRFSDFIDLLISQAHAFTADEERQIDVAQQSMNFLRKAHPAVVPIHNPSQYGQRELYPQWRQPQIVEEFYRRVGQGYYMADFLPILAEQQEVNSWFWIPHDGHFNNKGSEIYGAAIYRVVKEMLLSGDWPGGSHRRAFNPGHAKAQPVNDGIKVISGNYGDNCGAPRGNTTQWLATKCNGRKTCDFDVGTDARYWIGDPAIGCVKDFVAEYMCMPQGTKQTAHEIAKPLQPHKVFLTCELP